MPPTPFSALALGLALSFLGLAACSANAVGDDLESDEGATTITPHGDDSPGSLKVALPQGATNVESANVDVDDKNQWKPLSTVRSALSVGPHAVVVATSSPDFNMTSRAAAAVAANKETTLVVSALAPNVTGAPPHTIGLDSSTAHVQIGTATADGWIRAGYADGAHALAFAETEITFRFGVGGLDGTRFKIASGDVKKLDVWDTSQRRRVKVQAPASRDLPDGRCGNVPTDWVVSVSVGGSRQSVSLPAGGSIELGFAPWSTDVQYVLSNPHTTLSPTLPMSAPGAAPALFTIGRIDVNDVQLANGGTVKGTYQIYALDAQGQPSAAKILKCDLSTGTGVDLPAGKYRVLTHYQTVESGTKQDAVDVSIP